jgi:hypothetical protein
MCCASSIASIWLCHSTGRRRRPWRRIVCPARRPVTAGACSSGGYHPTVGALVEARFLGPFTVAVDGVTVELGGAKQRSVLAILLRAPGSSGRRRGARRRGVGRGGSGGGPVAAHPRLQPPSKPRRCVSRSVSCDAGAGSSSTAGAPEGVRGRGPRLGSPRSDEPAGVDHDALLGRGSVSLHVLGDRSPRRAPVLTQADLSTPASSGRPQAWHSPAPPLMVRTAVR